MNFLKNISISTISLLLACLTLSVVFTQPASAKRVASPNPTISSEPTADRLSLPSESEVNTSSPAIWQQNESPIIEVVFVLDTTGSMSGLIEGAKRKIWSIASDIIQAQQTPTIRMGLVGYRDKGDQYITKRHALTDDLDSVYNTLMQFQAAGGGDGPESVNQALYESIHLMPWSNDPRALRVVFLVGDFPPHMDYQDDVSYRITSKTANQKDIIINTIQCGNNDDTRQIWQEISQLAQGSFVALTQTGNMQAINTPYDEEISRLSKQQANTFINYGNKREQAAFAKKAQSRNTAPAASVADRSELNYRSRGNVKLYTGSKDLVEEIAEGNMSWSDVKQDALPAEIAAMDESELKELVAANQAERTKLDAELQVLIEKRRAYIKAEQTKMAAENGKDSFDNSVSEIIRSQGARKGLKY